MLWKRYLASLLFGLSLFFLESLKPDALVFMPTVTNSHITTTNETNYSEINSYHYPTKVMGEATATSLSSKSNYPLHKNILATVFWIGEDPSADNGYIANHQSAWDTSWIEHFGGVDDPNSRNGYYPASFTPKENPFYFALPYGDYTEAGIKANVNKIYWYDSFPENTSLLKNRWIKITYGGKVAYAQWEDVGPFADDDINYVFGSAQPQQEVGLDVSPAVRDYLGLTGRNSVSWQFADQAKIPYGPWKAIVTSSNPFWN